MRVSALLARFLLLQLLVWIQRAIRLLLRGLWLSTGLYLAYWGICKIFGGTPNPIYALLGAGLLASATFLAILFPWPRFSRLAWKLDRRLVFKEQISTAWQVAQEKPGGQVAELLVDDAIRLLNTTWWRIAWRGWYLGRDLLAASIIALLFSVIYFTNQFPAPVQIAMTEQAILPPIGQDANALDIFPTGIMGLKLPTEQPPEISPLNLDASEMEKLKQTLDALGQDLSQNTLTYELGQALRQQDLIQASQSLEDLSAILSSLSEDTQSKIAEALQKAAEKLSEDRIQPLASDVRSTAINIRNQETQAASEQMDLVAQDLRDLSYQLAEQIWTPTGEEGSQDSYGGDGAGIGENQRKTGEPRAFERLQGQGQSIEINDTGQGNGSLTQGQSDQEIKSPPGGQFSLVQLQDIDFVNTFLIPYRYSWDWRHVVSEYFSK